MAQNEPRLTDKDRQIWKRWRRTCLRWARSDAHKRRVLRASQAIAEMHDRRPDAYVAWSGGKDSTALAHLVVEACDLDVRLMSICDDLDFPGEAEYVRELADDWDTDLDVVRPDFSLQEWIDKHADQLDAGEDFHGPATDFADAAFYGVVEAYRKRHGTPGVYLGLRGDESDARAANAARGAIYQKRTGEVVCQPLRQWEGRDVYAYLFSRLIPIHPVYQCVRLHDHPKRVRKSWWIPGAHSRHGATVWLKTYWPSLYRRLCEILPDTRRHA